MNTKLHPEDSVENLQNKQVMNTVAIIKASTISGHFPERYHVKLQEKTLLEFIVDRMKQSKMVHSLVLATTTADEDDELAKEAGILGIQVYRGEYDDALGRLYGAASLCKADIVVTIMGDYPLVDPWETDKLLEQFIASGASFCQNEYYEGIITGLGIEIISYKLLEKSHSETTLPVHKQLGMNIFRDTLEGKDVLKVKYPHLRPNYRVNLAVPDDVVIINQIIEGCPDLSYAEIVQYIDNNPIVAKYAQQNISGTKEAGVEKLALFPGKVKKIISGMSSGDTNLSYPISVELSLTNICNLECIWCSDLDLRAKSSNDMELDLLKKLFKDLAENGTTGIVIEGGGEPTLHKKFKELLRYGKEYGLNLGLITNGVRLHFEEYVHYFDWIRISLDAATKKQFLDGKKRDLFDKVIGNIQKMVSQKHQSGTVVGVGYVLTKDNEVEPNVFENL